MKVKIISATPSADIERKVEKFFEENKGIDLKAISTALWPSGEGIAIFIFYESSRDLMESYPG